MKHIKVIRVALLDTYTVGKMYVMDDETSKEWIYLCDTLEDKYRGDNLEKTKIKGQTAIPKGKYKGICDLSNRFNKVLPHILEVPYFEGIRIHSGNTSKDTEGCILVGYNKTKGAVINSRDAFAKLDKFLGNNNFDIVIE